MRGLLKFPEGTCGGINPEILKLVVSRGEFSLAAGLTYLRFIHPVFVGGSRRPMCIGGQLLLWVPAGVRIEL